MTIQEAKDANLIPEEFKEFFPSNCVCGFPIHTNQELTIMECTNHRCISKKKYAAFDTLQQLGLKGMGVQYCYELMDYCIKEKAPYVIGALLPLQVPESFHQAICGNDETGSYNFYSIRKALEEPRTYAEALSFCGIPGLGPANCKTLFGKFNSVDELIADIKAFNGKTIEWVFKLAGYRGDKSIYAWSNSIENYLEELVLADALFNIIRVGGKEILLCVTGEVSIDGFYTPREKFMKEMKALAVDKYSLVASTAFNSLDYVIADSFSSSRKYREGAARNIIITAQEFKDKLVRGEL